MKLSVLIQSYSSHGGAETTTLAGEFLAEYLRDLPPGMLEVEVVACFRSRGKPHRTMQSIWHDFHDSLTGLPHARYSAKKGRLQIRYASHMHAEDAIDGEPVLDAFQAIVREVATVVASTLVEHKSLRKEVPLAALQSALAHAMAEMPATEKALQQLAITQQGHAIAAAAVAEPWEKLDVDWKLYHPQARELLDDPFFWDGVDEYAPHGNDTGADLLDAFRDWRRRHRGVPASRFLLTMLKRWNYTSGVRALLSKPMELWNEEDELMLEVLDEANIAIAFAQIKLEGTCDADLREAALHSIERQLDPAVHAHFSWTVPLEHRDRLEQLRAKLAAG